MSFTDLPVDVGPVYEGERIRGKQMYVELGGPKQDMKFELVRVLEPDKIEDGKVEIVGPDLLEMEEGSNVPWGIIIEMAGEQLEEDLESVLERRIHEFTNYIEGVMHLNQRYDVWQRVSKNAVKKGFNTLKFIADILMRLYKAELPIVEKIQVTIYTDREKMKSYYDEAMQIYEERDARVRGMTDEGVDLFYGCVLCQSFAPTHVCIITPERTGLCGAINWFDARASARVDPKGPNFKVEKGAVIDPELGEYEGVNAILDKKSLGEVTRVALYSALEAPHTSCGCFEAIVFYIPEVDGFGIVDRNFKGSAINGLPFSTMANQTGGGKQVSGFHGIAIEYMRSKKFLKYDGGWNRVVWLPSPVKERIKDAIPPELMDKIATEQEASDLDALIAFLKEKGHPLAEGLTIEEEEEEEEEAAEMESAGGMVPAAGMPMGTVSMAVPGVGGMGGFKIILKNARIHAEKVIIKRIDSSSKKNKGKK
ncbi:MAG: CO dehydrogenase/CO-methylating acetyl-CoA synthase complex subunit beta [Promethearchaeota archaeon]